jgi:hypothetical protein
MSKEFIFVHISRKPHVNDSNHDIPILRRRNNKKNLNEIERKEIGDVM